MAITHVASSAWAYSVSSVTPSLPTGTAVGDLVILFLVSKYDDASIGTPPAGWFDMGAVSNTGRTTGNDNGNLRGRAFYKVWQSGDSIPTLNPTPNNVSAAKASTYRIPSGSLWEIAGAMVADNTTGTPLAFVTAASGLGLMANDVLHVDFGLNSDVATFGGATTVTTTGVTFGTVSTTTADSSTASGTDMRNRSIFVPVTSTTTPSGNITVSTALGGTTTNSVGVALIARIRESAPTPKSASDSSSIAVSESTATDTPKSGADTSAISLTETSTAESMSLGEVSHRASTANFSAGDAAVSVNKPAGVVQGDYMIITLVTNGQVPQGGSFSGWTQLLINSTVTNPRIIVYGKVVDGNEGATFTGTLGSAVSWGIQCSAYSNVDSTIWDFSPVLTEFTNTGQTSYPASNVPTGTAGRMLVGGAGANSGSVTWSDTDPNTPGVWTEIEDTVENHANGKAHVYSHYFQADGAAVTSPTWIPSAGRAGGVWIGALKPAPGGVLPTSKSSTDTAAISVSETTSGSVTADASESISISVTETVSASGTMPGTETTALGLAEQAIISVVINTPDSAGISASESTASAVSTSVSDSGAVSVSETTAFLIDATKSVSDTASLATTEVSGISSTLPGTENIALSGAESASIAVAQVAVDSGTVSVSDQSSILANDARETSDSASISAQESTSSLRTIPTSDGAAVSATESTTTGITLTASDSGSLAISEVRGIQSVLPGTESATLAVAESTNISVTIAVSDTLGMTVADTSQSSLTVSVTDAAGIAVQEASGGDNSKSVGETISLATTESSSLYIDAAKSATDTTSVSIFDTSAIHTDRPGSDQGAITLVESASVVTSGVIDKSGVDAGSVAVAENRSTTVSVDGTDNFSITANEITTSSRTFVATDSGVITVADATTGYRTIVASDSAQVIVSEARAFELVPASASDALTVTVSESSVVNIYRPGVDAAIMSVSEVAVVESDWASRASSESVGVSMSEVVTSSLSSARIDNNTLSVSEMTIFSTIPTITVEAVQISVSEVVAVSKTLEATDELPLKVLDIGDLFAAEGFFETLAEDGSTVAISDHAYIWYIGGKNVPINFGTKGVRGTITNTGGKSNIRFGSRAERSIRF